MNGSPDILYSQPQFAVRCLHVDDTCTYLCTTGHVLMYTGHQISQTASFCLLAHLELEHLLVYTQQRSKELTCLVSLASVQAEHPERRPLWITPLNEASTRRLVCTTLKPTLLPHPEFAALSKTAEFLSGFVSYEPLPKDQPPEYFVSAQSTLEWQVRHC